MCVRELVPHSIPWAYLGGEREEFQKPRSMCAGQDGELQQARPYRREKGESFQNHTLHGQGKRVF